VQNLVQVLSSNATAHVATNGSALFPYETWAKATSNLNDAVTAVASAVGLGGSSGLVLVSNGVFTTTGEILLTTNITIQGNSGQYTDAVITRSPSGTNRLFTLSAAGATLDSLTISNGLLYSVATYGAGIYMTTGMIRNCRITRCVNTFDTGNGNWYGAGIYMQNGTLSGCLIDYNASASGGTESSYGSGVYMTGGLVTNCTIRNNTVGTYGGIVWGCGIYSSGGTIIGSTITSNGFTVGNNANPLRGAGAYLAGNVLMDRCVVSTNNPGSATTVEGGGVYVDGAAVIVQNSLVNNQNIGTTTKGGGIYLNAGTVRNCTVAGNIIPTNGVTPSAGLHQFGGLVLNTIVYSNRLAIGTATVTNYYRSGGSASNSCAPELTAGVNGNITDNPKFKNVAANDYHLATGSPCLDTGLYQSWMASATDLDGLPRKQGTHVDMGAYESSAAPKGTTIIFR